MGRLDGKVAIVTGTHPIRHSVGTDDYSQGSISCYCG
jgi:hypothetical protein